MNPGQLRLCDLKGQDCLFKGYVEPDDNHCSDFGMGPSGYETIGEDSPNIDDWLAEVRWIDIGDVKAEDIPVPELPNYIPTITRGSNKLFRSYHPEVVAVKLADVISPERLEVAKSLEDRFGIPAGTPVLLQAYGKDRLLENIWPKRHEIFPELAKLGFYAVTSLNYSVWFSQPHAERLINIKRAHITYEELQSLGLPAIPHMYWCGQINLDAWLRWLEANPTVKVMAIDMQTMRSDYDWLRALAGLKYFVSKLQRPIHFLITGPYKIKRVEQIKKVLPSMTLTNGSPARLAFASNQIEVKDSRLVQTYSDNDKSLIFKNNVSAYERLMKPQPKGFTDELLARYRSSLATRPLSAAPFHS